MNETGRTTFVYFLRGVIVAAALSLAVISTKEIISRHNAEQTALSSLRTAIVTPISYQCASQLRLGESAICRVEYTPQQPKSKNKYLHVDLIAYDQQLSALPVERDDIHFVPMKSSMSWLVTPKVDGLIDYVVRYVPYEVEGHGAKHNLPKTQVLQASMYVYEPLFSLQWFQNHTFAASFTLAVVAALGGIVGTFFSK